VWFIPAPTLSESAVSQRIEKKLHLPVDLKKQAVFRWQRRLSVEGFALIALNQAWGNCESIGCRRVKIKIA